MLRTAWEFFFGKPCPRCEGGNRARDRWVRFDGTGSWNMHPYRDDDGEMNSAFCERNGWFTRHRFATVALVLAIPAYSWFAILFLVRVLTPH